MESQRPPEAVHHARQHPVSERYLSGRQLPDKAIDVLDTACARVAINLSSPPKQISALTTLSHQQEAEIRQLERELRIGLCTDTSRMTEVLVQYDETLTALDELEAAWHQQQTLVREIIALRQQLLGVAEDDAAPLPDADTVEDTQPGSESEQDNTGAVPADEADREQPEETAETVSPVQRLAQLTAELDALHNDRLLVSPHVDKKQIAAVIAEWTGVPLNRLSQNEMSVITDLTKWLGDTIKGQDLAIASLHKHLLTARADLRRPGRPLGAFLLAGPSGVGKTETVLQLAELLYGGRQYLTTINMSEFQEKHTVSRLIGSPPGYVGYGEGGVLTEAIRQKPYSVVLLDEVEKAHPDVLNLFYQAFDKGEMADGEGRLWMASPELENYERRLQQLLDTSPVQPLETGMQMMRVADSRWPESLQQQQASTQWNEALKTRAQSSPQLRGWLQTRQDLHAFADLVMQREKEGLTLSYIKNVIWQAERGLGQETPVESLLTQYHDARAQKQNTDALEKQINERLEGVLSRWLLLKNNVMPEAATGTTAEK